MEQFIRWRAWPMKVLTVFGSRPEAIKLAPVIQELERRSASEDLISRVCVTGQHRQMLDQVLKLFSIDPHYDLDVMASDQTPTQVASAVMARLEPILQEERPDWVLVQGDTTTVAAAAMAAFYSRARVGHVEAGLRTRDKWRPFPEEINRRVAAVITDLHFAPTEQSRQNLLQEAFPEEAIVMTGNPVLDALRWVAQQPVPRADAAAMAELIQGNEDQRLLLVTAHRRENFGAPLERICGAVAELARRYGDSLRIVYPVHLNPSIQEPVHRLLSNIPNITLIPPLDYLPLVHLLQQARLVLTDSGGLQEEAPALGKPVLLLREVTERPEAVEAGTVKLVGADPQRIISETSTLLDSEQAYQRMATAINPYGDGRASRRIVSALLGEQVEPFVHG